MNERDASTLKEISQYLSLAELYQTSATYFHSDDPPDTDNTKFNFNYAGKFETADDRTLKCSVRFRLVGRLKRKIVVKIECIYTISYSLIGGKKIGDFNNDHFKVVSEHNAPYNAWPYLREFIQRALSNMDLPTIRIPLFRVMC